MIKSCEDIETQNDFHKLSSYSIRTTDMGLRETADMMRWSRSCLISPKLFMDLFETNFRIKK